MMVKRRAAPLELGSAQDDVALRQAARHFRKKGAKGSIPCRWREFE